MKDMPAVTVSDDLKAVLAQCQPGQTKEISVMVVMDKAGKVTLSPSDSEYGETGADETEAAPTPAPAPKAPKGPKRPKPVMAALGQMYQ